MIEGIGKGNIMIINSYPSDADDELGSAVIPKAILDYMNREKLSLDNVYYTYAIKDWYPRGYKYKVSDIKKYQPLLTDEIKAIKPKYVLLIGAQAVKATIGGSITSQLGTEVEKDGVTYLPTYNPGIVFRDPGKAEFVDHALGNFTELITGNKRELPELNIEIISSKAQIDRSMRRLRDCSYDIESTGLNRFEDEVNLLGYGNTEYQFIIPSYKYKWGPLYGKPLLFKRLIIYAIKMMNKHTRHRVAGNGKFDNLFLEYHYGIKPDITFDVVLASHALNENTANGVKENAILECNALDWDVNLNLKKGNVKNSTEWDQFITYLGYDIYYEYALYEVFKPRLRSDTALWKLFNHLYMPVIKAYEEVERNGVYVFTDQFKAVRRYLEGQLKDIERRLSRYKKDVNWASSKQVGEFLYEDLGLPIIERTESGAPSTGEATLKQLVDKHPAVAIILEHRGVSIQISHFIDGWIDRMHEGKLHPSFKMLTVTGRTSCKDPNLQQVPRDPRIRSLLGAPKGWSFIEADFSQAELRVATILSHDPVLKDIYLTGGDIHTSTFELVSGQKLSSDKYEAKEQRKKAKAVNFGFLYGMGWRKFKDYSRDTYGVKVTDKEAQQMREKFFKAYKELPKWHDKQRKLVRANGEVRNPIGRIRRLPDIYSSDKGKQAEAERQAINSPVQGFGSDLTLLGMAEVTQYSKYCRPGYKMDKSQFRCVGTVHDATLFEVKDEYLKEFVYKVKAIMDNPLALEKVFKFKSPIPIVVDVAIGDSWGAGTELKWENYEEQVEEFLDGKKRKENQKEKAKKPRSKRSK